MTKAQATALSVFLASSPVPWVGVHGDCVGADAQFDYVARLDKQFQFMKIFPGTNSGMRAFCKAADNDLLGPELPSLERNMKIAQHADILLAAPKEDHMVLRSGTWATVRYALKLGKLVAVLTPNGAAIPWSLPPG